MKLKKAKLSALVVLLAAIPISTTVYETLHSEKKSQNASRHNSTPHGDVSASNGFAVVHVRPEGQTLGGITTQALTEASWAEAANAQASVLNLDGYFSLTARLQGALAEARAAQFEVRLAEETLKRNQTLYSDGQNISAQTLQDTQANLANLRAKLISAQASSDALLSQIQQQFGPTLKHFAESASGEFKRLQSGQSCIVRIALPPDSTFTPTHKDHLELPSMPDLNAAYLSAAPVIDPSMEGPAFLYLVNATLPAGTRMPARLVKTGAHILKGVRIPAQALVWFGGQPWVYIKLDNSHFERRPLGSDRSLKDGYFASQSFKAGDIVVTRGSQLLLSDELRPPPNSVAACKDPECND